QLDNSRPLEAGFADLHPVTGFQGLGVLLLGQRRGFDKPSIVHHTSLHLARDHSRRRGFVDTWSESRIRFSGVFASPAVERAFRQRCFRDDLWLCCFLVAAAMLRVSVLLLVDYQHFGVGPAFWPLLAGRLVFLLASACALFALRRAASPAAADRLFFGWSF